MDKDHCVFIETISSQFDVIVYIQLFARNWRCGRLAWSLYQGCSEKIRKKDVVMTSGRWSSWSIQILQFWMLWWPVMKTGSTAMTQRPRDRVPMLTFPDPRRPDRANFWWSLFFDSTGMIYIHWIPTEQTINKEYYDEVLREFRKRFRLKRPALFKSGQWHFQLDNVPVHNSIFVTDYLTKIGIKWVPHPAYSPNVTFAYSLSSEVFIMRQLRRWKRLWWKSLTGSH